MFDICADPAIYGDSGICAHLPYLRGLAAGKCVTELGTGGADQSTVAWLAGGCASLCCFDLNDPGTQLMRLMSMAAREGAVVRFERADTTQALNPGPCDILFVDTLHDAKTVEAELALFARSTRERIVFHDVTSFGRAGQFAGADQGINLAIAEFLYTHLHWSVERYCADDNGLLTLVRGADLTARPARPVSRKDKSL